MKYKKLGFALAAVMITGTAGSAAFQNNLFGKAENPAAVHAEESTELTTAASVTEADESDAYLPNVKSIVKESMPSIVAITSVSVEKIQFWGREYEQQGESSGSGIIVAKTDDELLIATNNHVVEDAQDLTVCFSVDTEDDEDKLVSAKIKGTDSSLDLAVIAVPLDEISDEVLGKISVIQIGDSDSLEVGDWSIAIGNALGYGQSVTLGIVSALDRAVELETDNGVITNNMIQTDAAINFGNSGGALLDGNGRLIGINSAKAASTGVEGMGYAIPINTAKPIIEDLMNQTTREKVDEDKAGALGIRVTNVSEEARQIYNIPAGAYVYEVTEGGAAEEAGLKQGDVITRLDKTGIASMNEFLERMAYYEAGETVDVTIQRMGSDGYEEKVISVTLEKKPEDTVEDQTLLEDQDDTDSQEEEQDEDDGWFSDDKDFFSGLEEGRDALGFFR
ncbi:MAG: trypsin-like peptidase domain-containing protein [Eubacteriales bacterium]|nr:trypsin-like peptidase domain-containing protein [Eubacteriales bacterium]